MGTRDILAVQRTRLANERTLLAYIRTAIVCFIAGVTILKLIPDGIFILVTSLILIVSGILMVFLGIYTYSRTKKELSRNS
jgi:putative membrane protein